RLEAKIAALKNRRGRPVDLASRHLSFAVAVVLTLNDVPIAVSRRGVFVQILTELLFELYAVAPGSDSLFHTAKRASQFVQGQTPAQIRRLYAMAKKPGSSLATFTIWQTLYETDEAVPA